MMDLGKILVFILSCSIIERILTRMNVDLINGNNPSLPISYLALFGPFMNHSEIKGLQ